MARRRTLRPEEEDLWRAVAGTVNPRHGVPVNRSLQEPVSHLIETKAATYSEPVVIAPFQIGTSARPNPPKAVAPPPIQMDAKTHGKMTRGKIAPEARIDLHGMTLAEAHGELISFILSTQTAGLRLVLVITGKGKQRSDIGVGHQRTGVLRHQVPHWLRLPPLSSVVLQVSEAHLKHGGSGAYYVYLRRR